MASLSEDAFRRLLDDNGILRPAALTPPPRWGSYAVFAQRPDARLELETMKRHAGRFFSAKIGITVDKRYDDRGPLEVDAARFVVATEDGTANGTRLCFARRTEPADLDAAQAAEQAQGTSGLALLAQRCPMVWLVVPETDDDHAALTIATIFASTLLGPILAPDGTAIFGVRTARMKLEAQARH
ncbi:hypothetical protein AKJ09_07924 [Labilithrix luteola]|uniref:Uncharacterized protein n=1 Tax=Labilithrix luteola TaxID=1391654 RepID=A0A0K1Q622_9BACT|nr:hypothetical protein AKJ09_07924 [Labilithrix luteola]